MQFGIIQKERCQTLTLFIIHKINNSVFIVETAFVIGEKQLIRTGVMCSVITIFQLLKIRVCYCKCNR